MLEFIGKRLHLTTELVSVTQDKWKFLNGSRTTRFFPLLLVFIAIVSHWVWFTPGTILFHSDWLYWSDLSAQQGWRSLGAWGSYFGFGETRIQLAFTIVQAMWSAVALLGFSFDTAVKVTLMWPIAILGFLSPYYATRYLLKDNFIAFISALFYGTTAYFILRQGAHLPIAFIYALAPFVFLTFAKAIDMMRMKEWIIFASVYTIGLCYEVRIMYIFTFVLMLYALLSLRKISVTKEIIAIGIAAGVSLIGLNAFWIVPTVFGGTTSAIAKETSQELFGSNLFDLPHALAISPASWTGDVPDESFVMMPVPPYMWLTPLVIFCSLAAAKKLSESMKKYLMFFLIVTLAGLFLTKQELYPIRNAYQWLYTHAPGFSLFREASKFYILTAWGYMGLLGIGLLSVKKAYPRIFPFAAMAPIIVAFISLTPVATGSMRTLFEPRKIPADYTLINSFVARQKGVFRTMWVPTDPKWGYFDQTHPRVSAASVAGGNWKASSTSGENPTSRQNLTNLFERPVANDLFDSASVKYVVVPLRDSINQDDFFRHHGDDRQYYVDLLDAVPWLKKIKVGTSDNVAVYENVGYQKHIDTKTSIYSSESADNIDELHTLNKRKIGRDFNFALLTKDQLPYGTKVENLFSELDQVSADKSGTHDTVNFKTPSTLYVKQNQPVMRADVVNGSIKLSAKENSDLSVNGKSIAPKKINDSVLADTRLKENSAYYVANGLTILPFSSKQATSRNLGLASGDVRLLISNGTNLIENGSLENGLWKKQVDDCNNYDNTADLEMNLDNEFKTNGKQSLLLFAGKHTACTGPKPVKVEPGQEYLFSFDYNVDFADQIGYTVEFNDPSHTTIKQRVQVSDRSKHTVYRTLVAPKEATAAQLEVLGIPNTRNRRPASTNYDNLRLEKLNTVSKSVFDSVPDYQSIPLAAGTNNFTYKDLEYSGKNLITNPSLEKGLWHASVDDCNAYDNKPELKMNTSDIASDGKKSLELSSKKHIACTGPPEISVKENTTYLLSFDHQSPNAKTANYYVSFKGDNIDNPNLSGDIKTNLKWQSFSRVINTPTGTKSFQLSLRARADEKTGKYSINRYDNFRLIEMPTIQNNYFVLSEEKSLNAPQSVEYTFLDTSKRAVHIKGANGPFFLTMAETYSPQWRLVLNNSSIGTMPWSRVVKVAENDHVNWDAFSNGWYIDPHKVCESKLGHCVKQANGTFDIELVAENSAQRWYYLGIVISALSALGVVSYIAIAIYLERQKTKKMPEYRSRNHNR